jgi:hypothetical protein
MYEIRTAVLSEEDKPAKCTERARTLFSLMTLTQKSQV